MVTKNNQPFCVHTPLQTSVLKFYIYIFIYFFVKIKILHKENSKLKLIIAEEIYINVNTKRITCKFKEIALKRLKALCVDYVFYKYKITN